MMERWIFLRGGRLSGRTKLLLAVLFVAALAALIPLRVVLGLAASEDGRGLSAKDVEGQVWSGRIFELRAGPLPLGTVRASLNPLPLLIGRSELHVEREGTVPFVATLSGSGESFALKGVTGSVPVQGALGTLPATSIGFSDFRYRAEGGQCAEADGTVSLTLPSFSPLIPSDVVMGGRARCDKGALYVPMTGPTGMERLFLRLEPSGTWTADVVLTGLPAEVAQPLLEQGFTARSGGIGLRASGKL